MLLKYGRVAASAYGGVMPNSIRPQNREREANTAEAVCLLPP